MKRKLDSDDIPATEAPISQKAKTDTFESLGLDARLLQAVAREKFSKPTLVQARAIPEALAGKDILARAKTGSGKTAAYALPILQSILRDKTVSPT
jgi:ATP-dependent RNA helicase DDX56/DBP9